MCSPAKKKKKSSKTDKRKKKKSAQKEEESTSKKKERKRGKPLHDKSEDPIKETGGSSLRESQFSMTGNTPGKKTQANSKPPHNHKYKQENVEGSVILSQEEDCHTELTMKFEVFSRKDIRLTQNWLSCY